MGKENDSKKILEILNVSKSFGKSKVIDDINLTVNSSEVFGFLGPNGAGKTTTIKMIVGLLSIDHGDIIVNGYSVKKEFEKSMQYIGAIVENPDMYEYLSGYENLKLKARIYGIKKARIDEVVELVGLKDRIKDKVKKYSLGMKQRLGLAQALLHNPKILILDEPTNGLDPSGIRQLRDILKKLAHQDGICVFVSSHLLNEMQLMCDRVAVIDKGKIVKVETITEVIEGRKSDKNEKDVYTVIADKADLVKSILNENEYELVDKENLLSFKSSKEDIPKLIKILVDKGILIYEVFKEKQSLEEAFLDLTKGGSKNA